MTITLTSAAASRRVKSVLSSSLPYILALAFLSVIHVSTFPGKAFETGADFDQTLQKDPSIANQTYEARNFSAVGSNLPDSIQQVTSVEENTTPSYVEDDPMVDDSNLPISTQDISFCQGDDYHFGIWTKSPIYNDVPSCQWNNHRNCVLDPEQPRGRERIEKSMQWEWIPNDCRLHEFNGSQVVSTLQKEERRIFYFGDSLNNDMGVSMRCLLDGSTTPKISGELVRSIREDMLGCPDKREDAEYGTNLYCSNLTSVEAVWKSHIDRFKITERDIFVINTGAHWSGKPEDAAIAFSNIANAIANVFDGLVIVRTTVMGHRECHLLEEPLESNATLTHANGTLKELPYNWSNFGKLNSLITKAMEQSKLQNYKILYVDMFERRPDGHHLGANNGDCLHYCVPGPIGWWNKLLYHILYDTFFSSEKASA